MEGREVTIRLESSRIQKDCLLSGNDPSGYDPSTIFGTLGCLAKDKTTGALYVISAAHIFLKPDTHYLKKHKETLSINIHGKDLGNTTSDVMLLYDPLQAIDIAAIDVSNVFTGDKVETHHGVAGGSEIPVYDDEMADLVGHRVFKYGARTGYTEGTLIAAQTGQSFSVESVNNEFATPGDSGAIVYADIGGIKTAFGMVHMSQHYWDEEKGINANRTVCVNLNACLGELSKEFGISISIKSTTECFDSTLVLKISGRKAVLVYDRLQAIDTEVSSKPTIHDCKTNHGEPECHRQLLRSEKSDESQNHKYVRLVAADCKLKPPVNVNKESPNSCIDDLSEISDEYCSSNDSDVLQTIGDCDSSSYDCISPSSVALDIGSQQDDNQPHCVSGRPDATDNISDDEQNPENDSFDDMSGDDCTSENYAASGDDDSDSDTNSLGGLSSSGKSVSSEEFP